MDIGVGHAGLVTLYRFLGMKPLTHTSYTKHTHVIYEANKVVVMRTFDDVPTVVHRVYLVIDSEKMTPST